MTPDLPAIIAASGLSTRMGTSKSLLESDGQSFLARVVGTFREAGTEPVLVVVRNPSGPEGSAARAAGGLVIQNPDPSPGPISSLQAGIRSLPPEAPGTFFCPADHPRFLPETVRSLADAFTPGVSSIVTPTWEGRRGHPVIFGRALFPELLEPGLPQGARTVVRRYLESRVEIPVDDPGILIDIDTPEEYRRHIAP